MFDFIQHYFHEHRQSPLIREIQTGCQIASYKSALDRLIALERKGYIKRVPSKHRGIRLARRPSAAQPEASLSLDTPATLLERAGEFEGAGEGAPA